MKKMFLFLTLIAFACVEDVQLQQSSTQQPSNLQAGSGLTNGIIKPQIVRSGTFTTFFNDWSNTVHTVVIEKDAQENAQGGFGPLTMPAGYVLIGGGAYTSDTEAGGYLVASYPCPGCASWLGESHDHQVADTHTLTVYSVGLKLDGVSATTLASHISYANSPVLPALGPAHAPSASWPLSAGYTLIGGGTRVFDQGGQGNFMIYSYPTGTTWNSGSKDINVSSLAQIEAFVVGIHTTIPGFVGQLEINMTPTHFSVGTGTVTQSVNLASGWAPACVGANSTALTNGRILTGLRPPCATNTTQFQAQSKDCGVASGGSLDIYPIVIRKKM